MLEQETGVNNKKCAEMWKDGRKNKFCYPLLFQVQSKFP